MLKRPSLVLLGLVAAAACSSTSGASRFPAVPENAKNPIVLGVEGATVEQVTKVAIRVVSDQGITMIEADTKAGIVETRRFDIGHKQGSMADGYPPDERLVFYVFAAGTNPQGIMVTEILGYYRPNPAMARTNPSYRELLPTNHPGYVYQLRLEAQLKDYLIKDGVKIVTEASSGGQTQNQR